MKKFVGLLYVLMTCSGWALTCSTPVTISEPNSTHWISKPAINYLGNVAVAWKKRVDDENALLQNAIRSAMKWTSPESISDPHNIQLMKPFVHADGDVSVIWGIIDKNTKQLHCHCSRKETTGWSTPTWLDPQDIKVLTANFDSRGKPFILGSRSAATSKKPGLFAIHYPIVAGYEPLQITESEDLYDVQIIKDKEGRPTALWTLLQYPYGIYYDYGFQVAHYQDSGVWTPVTNLGTMGFKNIGNEAVENIEATININRNLAIIWSHHVKESPKYTLLALVKSEKKPTEIINSKSRFQEMKILIDDKDNAVAVWVETVEKKNVVRAAIKAKGKPWTAADNLSRMNKDAECVEIKYDNKGHFVVVWAEADDNPYERSIFGTTFSTQTEKWSPASPLSPPDQNCWLPAMAFNDQGQGVLTWTTYVQRRKEYQVQVADLTVD